MNTPANAQKWFTIVRYAIENAVDLAEVLGVELPGADEIADLKSKANELAAEVLPHEAAILEAAVQIVAARVEAKIASLGKDRRCPHCNDVLRMRSNGTTRTWSCDKQHYSETELL